MSKPTAARFRAELKSSASFRWSKLLVTGVGAGLFLAFPALTVPAWANPKDGTVSTGSASIATPSTNVTKVDQKSEDVVINWSSFNVGAGQTTQFVQPNASAIAVNRIGGASASQVLGTLDANGRVVLINGNGILFGKNSQVNVGSLIATSTGGSDSDLLSGKFTKAGKQNAAIVNNGVITVGTNGTVALVAPNVTNNGTVQARLGTVALGAANQFTVDFAGDGLVSFAAQGSVNGHATAANMGLLSGANVSMTARSAEGLAEGVVNASGIIQAQGVQNIGGTIVLDAGDGGRVNLQGANLNASGTSGGGAITVGGWNQAAVNVDKSSTINASAIQSGNGGSISVVSNDTSFAGSASARGGLFGGNGGTIETSGHTLSFADSHIDASAAHGVAGTWLLDPDDLDVDAAAATSIDDTLNGNTGVILQTTSSSTSGPGNAVAGEGDINILSALSWSTGATLTLNAYHSINIDAPITIIGAGKLVFTTNYAGGSGGGYFFNGGNVAFTDVVAGNTQGSLTINGQSFGLANSVSQLASDISANPYNNYALANSYNASTDGTYSTSPIGTQFGGTLEGLGNTISNLSINQSAAGSVGLFNNIGSSATVRDIGLVNANVQGSGSNSDVGALAGTNNGKIEASFVTGTVTGGAGSSVGGLVGYSTSSGAIYESSATGTVTELSAGSYVGGLIGDNKGPLSGSSANETVSGGAGSYIGGLVGYNESTITSSYATGSVSGPGNEGGLVGDNSDSITASYAASSVEANGFYAGGFVGINTGTITGSYSTGPVGGNSYLGGFVGNNSAGSISDDYSTSAVSGADDLGGFVGENGASISYSYAMGSVTGGSESIAVGGFAGLNESGSTIANAYSVGSVVGLSYVGGFVGTDQSSGGITTSYWDTTSSGVTDTTQGAGNLANDSGITGLDAAGMANSANFSGWTFGGLNSGANWVIVDVDGSLNNAGGAAGGTTPMLLSEYSTTVTNAHQLQLMELEPTANYTLANNINASGTAGGDVWGTAGFVAVGGNAAATYSGTFDGAGHTISGLTIDDTTNANVGLFGYVSGTIENVGLLNASVTGSGTNVGALVGQSYSGTVSNSYATGSVVGTDSSFGYVGGLVGYAVYSTIGNSNTSDTVTAEGFDAVGGLLGEGFDSTINSSFATGAVAGEDAEIGGLVGEAYGGTINASYATGTTTSLASNGSLFIGGLIGWNQSNTITGSYATGTVNGQLSNGGYVGGLAGYNWSGTITGSYATGAVTGGPNADVGGLVGYNYEASITDSYATGAVAAGTSSDAGGLVGNSQNYQSNQSSITYSYASGSVTGASQNVVGGFIGENDGYIEDAYSTGSVTGGTDSGAGGFAGHLDSNSQVYESYSRGAVTAAHGSTIGGFVGYDGSEGGVGLGDDYWDTTASGISNAAQGAGNITNDSGVGGLTATQMTNSANFSGWEFGGLNSDQVWVIVDTDGSLNNAGGAAGGTTPMLINEYSTTITNAHQLQLMALDPTASYSLATSINASGTSGGDVWVAQGFMPVGNSTTPFSGSFSGNGNTISNLTIYLPSASDVGLFGNASGTITSVGLVGGSVTGNSEVGGLVGSGSAAIIINSYNTGAVIGSGSGQEIGGLVGVTAGGSITGSYASGSVTGSSTNAVGGLVGWNDGAISESYASGSVTGHNSVGGLTGINVGSVVDSYETGTVTGNSDVGGLTGYNFSTGSIDESYEIGAVSGASSGGIAGYNGSGTLGATTAVYYNNTENGQGVGGGTAIAQGGGLSFDNMQYSGNFTGWTFGTTGGASGWVIVDVDGSLNNFGEGGLGGTTPLLLDEYSTNITNAHQLQLMELDPTVSYSLANTIDASGTAGGNVWGSGGFVAIGGNGTANFSGAFFGNGRTINALTINDSTNSEVGLFGEIAASGSVDSVVLTNLSVTGGANDAEIGGLAGMNYGLVSQVSVSGTVSDGGNSSYLLGGLVGSNGGTISQSFATDRVLDTSTGASSVGGLVGDNQIAGSIEESYATGAILLGSDNAMGGGLVGINLGAIDQTYSLGSITGGGIVGGLIGEQVSGTVTNSYWDTDTSNIYQATGSGSSSGITADSTTELQAALPAGFDPTVWNIVAGSSFPYLSWQFSGTPEVVSGYVYSDAGFTPLSGASVSIISGGNELGTTSSYGSGYYYDLIAPGALASTGVAANVNGDGIAYTDATGSVGNLDIFGGELIASTSGSSLAALGANLGATFGALLGPAQTTINGVLGNIGDTLAVNASGSFTLDQGVNVSQAISITAVGNLTVSDAIDTTNTLVLTTTAGNIAVQNLLSGSFVDFNSSGTVTESGAGAINAGVLEGSSSGGTALNGANEVATLNGYSNINSGGFSLNNTQALIVADEVVSGTGSLSLTTTSGGISIESLLSAGNQVALHSAGTIAETGNGQIEANTLTGSSAGAATLTGGNDVGALGAFTNTGSGGFALTDEESFTVNGAVSAGSGDLTLTAEGGNILIAKLLSTSGTATLSASATEGANGTIRESGAGAIDAATLTGSADGATTLNGANQIGTLGAFSNTGGAFALTDDENLTISGAVNVGGYGITLVDTGTIGESTGTIDAGSLTGNAGGATTLNGANEIATLAAFTNTGGSFALTDDGNLTIAGTLNAGGQSVTLADEGTLSESTGTIDAASLSGSATGATRLATANQIASLGSFTNTGGSFALTDGQNLTISGTLNASSYGVTLVDSGTIAESSGTIDSGTLTGSSNGGTTLTGANQVATLNAFTNTGSGGFALTDGEALTVNGAVNSGTGDLALTTNSGNIAIRNQLTAGGNAILNSSGTLVESGSGAISASSLTGSASGVTTLKGANQIASLGAFSNTSGNFALTDDEGLTISGTLNASSYGVTLVDSGTIGESTGTIDSGTLTGSSNGGATLTGANQVATLDAFTNTGSGGFALTDGEALTVNGAVNSGTGDLALTTNSGNIAIRSQLTAGGNAILNSAGTLVESGSGAISASSLTGGAAGATTLNGANQIAGLGAFTNTGGNFALTDDEGLTISGTLNVSSYGAALVDTGTIGESTGTIDSGTLTGSSTGGATLGGSNEIATLNAFTNTGSGGFALNDGEVLTVNGAVNSGTGNLSLTTQSGNIVIRSQLTTGGSAILNSAGTLVESGSGAISASSLTGGAGGATTLNGANQIASLGAFTNTGGAFALTDDEGLTISGVLNAGTHAVTLADTATLGESTGSIEAGTLTGSSAGGATLNGGNQVGALGAFTNTGAGGFALTDDQSLTANGAVNAGSGGLSLTTDGGNLLITALLTTTGTANLSASATEGVNGTIKESGSGAIDAATLTGSADSTTTLNGANQIATLGAFANTGGAFALTDDENLTISGAVNAGNYRTTLVDTGTIGESTGTIDAGSLTGSSTGGTTLNGSNLIASLVAFTNTGAGGVALKDGEALTVNGIVNAGAGALALTTTSGNLAIANALSTTGAASLNSAGTLKETGSGAIDSASLNGGSVGGTVLNGANEIATLNAFTNSGAGGFALTDGEALTVNGAVNAGTGNLALTTTSGNIAIKNQLTAGNQATLTSAGTLIESGSGALSAASLTGSSSGTVTLNGANQIASLGTFANTGTGGIVLKDGEALTVNGALNSGTGNLKLTTTSGGIALKNQLTSGNQVTLISAGTIGEIGSGAISASSLTGSSVGSATFNGTNLVSTLAGFTDTSTGGFVLTDGETLTVGGAVNAGSGNLSLTTTVGNLNVNNTVSTTGSATLISAGTLGETGAIQAASLSGSSVGGATLGDSNLVATLNAFTNTGAGGFALTDGEALTVGGAVNAGTGTLSLATTVGGITIDKNLTSGGQASLTSVGTISESGHGAVTAASLTGSSSGGATLNGSNQFATLDAFTNSGAGGFALTDGQALTVGAILNAGSGNVALMTTSGDISIANTVNAGGQASLSSAGTIGETGPGVLDVGSLTGSSVGGANLNGSNRIATLGAFSNTASGDIVVEDGEALTVTGSVNAGSGNLTLATTSGGIAVEAQLTTGAQATLNSAGTLVESGSGSISASSLTGSAIGGATLNGANEIGALNAFTNAGSGGFALTNGESLEVDGAVNPGTGNLALTTTSGGIEIDAALNAPTITLSSAGAVTQSQAITASDLDLLGAGGSYALTDASNSIGTLAANTGSINLADSPTLIVNAVGGTNGVTTSGNASLTSISGGIEIENLLSSAARVTLNSAGPLSEVGSGAIDAALLTGSTTGGAALGGANLIAGLGPFTNTLTGNVSIKDNEGLTINGAVDVVTGTISTPFGSEPIGALTLVSTGTLSESGAGRIEAGTLMGSSVGGATLNGANLITIIGSFANSGSGDIGLTNNQTLTVAGPLNAGTGNLALTATAGNLLINGTVEGNTVTFGSTLGSVTGPGPITAAVLNVTANTGIDLTGPNEITTIGTNDTNSGPDFINQ